MADTFFQGIQGTLCALMAAGATHRQLGAVAAAFGRAIRPPHAHDALPSPAVRQRSDALLHALQLQEWLENNGVPYNHHLSEAVASARRSGLLDRTAGRRARTAVRRANEARHTPFLPERPPGIFVVTSDDNSMEGSDNMAKYVQGTADAGVALNSTNAIPTSCSTSGASPSLEPPVDDDVPAGRALLPPAAAPVPPLLGSNESWAFLRDTSCCAPTLPVEGHCESKLCGSADPRPIVVLSEPIDLMGRAILPPTEIPSPAVSSAASLLDALEVIHELRFGSDSSADLMPVEHDTHPELDEHLDAAAGRLRQAIMNATRAFSSWTETICASPAICRDDFDDFHDFDDYDDADFDDADWWRLLQHRAQRVCVQPWRSLLQTDLARTELIGAHGVDLPLWPLLRCIAQWSLLDAEYPDYASTTVTPRLVRLFDDPWKDVRSRLLGGLLGRTCLDCLPSLSSS